ncbi:MAG: 4Fe-4S binding protein [Dehalococcoidales bacterium]|nr:4Fe-4S binding protein [Dehalococcoidales bacterium]
MDEVYDKVAAVVGAPGSKRFAGILEAMMTVEEAGYLLELKTPRTAAQLAMKLKLDEKILQAKLDDMADRLLIRRANDSFVVPPSVVMFHHGAIGWIKEEDKARLYPLWGDFFFEEWGDIIVDDFIKRKNKGVPGAHRVVPAYKALEASPKIRPEQILWYEDMRQLLKKSAKTYFMMCGCRGLWRKCDSPIDVCIKLQLPTSPPMMAEKEFVDPPKETSYEEGMKIVSECEDIGLVHIPLNTAQGDLYCSCCDDCCMVIQPLLKRGNLHEILTPSRYRAAVDEDKCVGCQKCLSRCKFDAIAMAPVPGTDKFKARINAEHCMGCGACVITCKTQAMTLELVRPPSHIPTCSIMELFAMEAKK